MQTLLKTTAALGLVMAVGVASAPAAFSKAHGQGMSDTPGQDVGSETAGPAQGLGGALGNGKSASEASGGASDAGPSSADDGTNGGGSQR